MINSENEIQKTEETVNHLLKRKDVRELLKEHDNEVALHYIAELYKGNGWIVSFHKKGMLPVALLLSYPKTPSRISLIVRIDSSKNELQFDDARDHLLNMENELSAIYNCHQFCLIAFNSFEEKCRQLEKYNLLLQDWSYIETLQEEYSEEHFKEPRIQLFSHNRITYRKIQTCWQKHHAAAVIQATGTGKSYLIAKVLQDFRGENRLVMAPSNYILSQMKEHIRWESDQITFMTYAKGMYLTDEEIQKINPSLVVLDEFHRCGADEWGHAVSRILSAFPNAKVLGTSATPIRYLDGGRDMAQELFNGNVAENLNLSQAIVRKIIPMPVYVSALYTIQEEILKLRSEINVSRLEEEEKTKLFSQVDAFNLNWERSSGIPVILKKHIRSGEKKFIVFCRDSEHIIETEKLITEWFHNAFKNEQINLYRVYTEEKTSDEQLKMFSESKREGFHLLLSINMLNEGLHVDDVHGVILLRPTASPNIFYQQIGRCLKTGTAGTPLIFDFVNNFSNIRSNDFIYDLNLNRKLFNDRRNEDGLNDMHIDFTIIDETRVITELFGEIRFNVDWWEDGLKKLIAYKKRFGNCLVPADWKEDEYLGSWVARMRTSYRKKNLEAYRIEKLNEIGFTWEPFDERFDAMYDALVLYKEKSGSCHVPQGKEYSVLANWVGNVRQRYKNGILDAEKINRLEAIGFTWDYLSKSWEDMYEKLKIFKAGNGHCNVIKKFTDDQKLITWARIQAKALTENKLTEARKKLLNDIGFVWNVTEEKWFMMYNALKEYKEKYGNLRPNKHKEATAELGRWCGTQRKAFLKNKIDPNRKLLLDEIGFEWSPIDEQWKQNYLGLKKYYSENGHTDVPSSKNKKYKYSALSSWVRGQRDLFKDGKLTEDKIKNLEELNFDWNPTDKHWNKMYEQLKEYKEKFGQCNIVHVKLLGQYREMKYFIGNQRQSYKKGILAPEKAAKLEALGLDWGRTITDVRTWDEYYRQLYLYYLAHGNCNVPQHSESYGKLAAWLNNQRVNYRNNQVSNDKIEKLNSLHFSWEPSDESWMEKFLLLKKYKDAYGTCYVFKRNSKDNRLGGWSKSQRTLFAKKALGQKYIDLLNSISFEWEQPENMYDIAWENNFNKILQFKAVYGHCNVPENVAEHKQLNNWVGLNRKHYRKKKLKPAFEQRLNEIGFEFNPVEILWEERYAALKMYYEKNGHTKLDSRTEPTLYSWSERQRKLFNENKLEKNRIAVLNGISFSWVSNLQVSWNNFFQKLMEFKNEHGHCNAPNGFKKDSVTLGSWVGNQRQNYKKGRLSPDKVMQLNIEGFEWSLEYKVEENWMKQYEIVKTYKEKYGHCNVPKRGEFAFTGRWIITIRQEYKKGKLDVQKIKLLNELGFEWDLTYKTEESWNSMFLKLMDYKKKYDTVNIPVTGSNPLTNWINVQRRNYKQNKLSAERLKKLTEAGVIIDVYDRKWEDGFAAYCEFVKKHHTNLTRKSTAGEKLYSWAHNQRKDYHKNKLSKERIERLEKAGFLWQV
ncbi:MAG: Helicase associated domain protein [Bacteroidia bacterium]